MIEAARAMLGSPYKHQGRVPGRALDCVGVLVLAARQAGYSVIDCRAYSAMGDPGLVADFMARNADPIPPESAEPGDVLGFRRGRDAAPVHLALLTEKGILHTSATIGRVVEHRLDARWQSRLVAAWRIPSHKSH